MDPLIIALVVVVLLAVAGLGLFYARSRRAGATPPDRPSSAGTAAAPPELRAPTLWDRLAETRRTLGGRLGDVFGRGELDDAFWEDLEDTLVASDMGVKGASHIVGLVRRESPRTGEEARRLLAEELRVVLAGKDRELELEPAPAVILVVGVNGTGKTTSIGKLAAHLAAKGRRVLLGSADTFRAAADQQLRVWAERSGSGIVGGQGGADPAAVAFDAYHSAKAGGYDAVIIDTAGRLQTKTNLMEELAKIARVLRREAGELNEVLLVVDGTTGQNALSQAQIFTEAVGVTGVILTKLDGTSRGGVVVAVEEDLAIPVKFVGLGETADDLVAFDPDVFVDALLET